MKASSTYTPPGKLKSLLWLLTVVVVSATLTGFTYSWERLFPDGETNEVYRQFANRDNLEVTFVKAFQLNDTTTVDITTIHAKDRQSWDSLMNEMGVPKEAQDEAYSRMKLKHHINSSYRKKGDLKTKPERDDPQIYYVFFDYLNMFAVVYDIDNKDKIDIIDRNDIQGLKTNSTFMHKITHENVGIIERLMNLFS